MYGMAGTRIGPRPYDVGGSQSYRCSSIQFSFRVRCPLSITLIPDHSLQRFEAGQFAILIDPSGQHRW